MIRGYFLAGGNIRRPYVNAVVEFPSSGRLISAPFLIDTGADCTILSAQAAVEAGIAPTTRPSGVPTRGVGGVLFGCEGVGSRNRRLGFGTWPERLSGLAVSSSF